MPLITVVLTLIVIGLLLWLAQKYIPMEPVIWRIILAVVVISVVLWLLDIFGLLSSFQTIRIGR